MKTPKLTPEQAAAFKHECQGVRGKPLQLLADRYGISYALARKIASGQSYSDVKPVAKALTVEDIERVHQRKTRSKYWPKFHFEDAEEALEAVAAIAAKARVENDTEAA